MICNKCGKVNKHNDKFCVFCGSLIDTDVNLELYKVVRRDNIKFMTDILLGINLTLSILFTFLSFVTESYTKHCLLALAFVCLIIYLSTQIIKNVKLKKIEGEKHKTHPNQHTK